MRNLLFALLILLFAGGCSAPNFSAIKLPAIKLPTVNKEVIPEVSLHPERGDPGKYSDYLALMSLHSDIVRGSNAKVEYPHQSFPDYLKTRPRRKTSRRSVIYVQPIGKFDAKQTDVIKKVAQFLSISYNSQVKVQPVKPLNRLTARAREVDDVTGVANLHVGTVLNKLLLADIPKDAMMRIGLTNSDLEVPTGHNYTSIYGMGYMRFRVAVCSFYRLHQEYDSEAGYIKFLRRALKIASHEAGHTLSLPHCEKWECNMNARSSLMEVDDKPLWLCPDCVAKICWATGSDPVARFRRLACLCQKFNLKREASFYNKSAETMAKARNEARGGMVR